MVTLIIAVAMLVAYKDLLEKNNQSEALLPTDRKDQRSCE